MIEHQHQVIGIAVAVISLADGANPGIVAFGGPQPGLLVGYDGTTHGSARRRANLGDELVVPCKHHHKGTSSKPIDQRHPGPLYRGDLALGHARTFRDTAGLPRSTTPCSSQQRRPTAFTFPPLTSAPSHHRSLARADTPRQSRDCAPTPQCAPTCSAPLPAAANSSAARSLSAGRATTARARRAVPSLGARCRLAPQHTRTVL